MRVTKNWHKVGLRTRTPRKVAAEFAGTGASKDFVSLSLRSHEIDDTADYGHRFSVEMSLKETAELIESLQRMLTSAREMAAKESK